MSGVSADGANGADRIIELRDVEVHFPIRVGLTDTLLRRQIREQIKAGRSDDQILAYMTDRYGDFVRYRPPLKGTTVVLWSGPFVLLAIAAGGLAWYVRRRRTRVAALALSPAEETRVARLLGEAGDDRRA